MQIRDIVKIKNVAVRGGKILSVSPETSLDDAAKLLGEHNVGLMVVLDNEKLVGVLSERDIVRAIGKGGAAALDRKTGDVMTKGVKACQPTDHPFDIMQAMTKGRFRHMPVVDGDKLQGLISATDILRYVTEKASPQEQAMMWTKISWV